MLKKKTSVLLVIVISVLMMYGCSNVKKIDENLQGGWFYTSSVAVSGIFFDNGTVTWLCYDGLNNDLIGEEGGSYTIDENNGVITLSFPSGRMEEGFTYIYENNTLRIYYKNNEWVRQ